LQINSDNISSLISKANSESTSEAKKLYDTNSAFGKVRPIFASKIKFITSFIKNENKYSLTDRIVFSAIKSFTDFITYLKLLKLKKVI
jgi:hypothetical protein